MGSLQFHRSCETAGKKFIKANFVSAAYAEPLFAHNNYNYRRPIEVL